MKSKVCSKCNEEKTLNRFQFRKDRGHYATVCNECQNTYRRNYYINNPEAKIKRQNYKNKWQKENREKGNISNNVRCKLNQALKSQNTSKSEHTFDLIGCSINELNDWLEFTKPYFIPDDYEGKLHIDHFKPLSMFDLNNPIQLKEACHWSNLRYLTLEQNLKKSNKNPTPEDKFKMLVLKKFYVSKVGDIFKLRETPKASTTTSSEKSFEGTELMPLPNGNNVEDIMGNPQPSS